MLEATRGRLARTPELDLDGLERVQNSTVAIVGAGVLGGNVIHHLGLLGVPMMIVDADRVAPENLGNAGFNLASVGEWKSEARARQVKALNPDCAVEAVNARVEDLGLAAFADCQLLIGGLDNRRARVRLDEISRLGMPWIDAAVDGAGQTLLGTVTVFDPCRSNSACYLCRHNSESLAEIVSEERGPGCPSWRRPEAAKTAPTLQASPLAGIVAGFQALWATRLLLGRGDELISKQLVISADHLPRLQLLELKQNPQCLAEHRRLAPLRSAPGDTLGELWSAVGATLGAAPDALVLHHRSLVLGLECPECGARRDLVRLGEALGDDEVRCGCRPQAELLPVELSQELSDARVRQLADRRWTELGFPARDVVTVTAGVQEVHFVVNEPPSRQGRPEVFE